MVAGTHTRSWPGAWCLVLMKSDGGLLSITAVLSVVCCVGEQGVAWCGVCALSFSNSLLEMNETERQLSDVLFPITIIMNWNTIPDFPYPSILPIPWGQITRWLNTPDYWRLCRVFFLEFLVECRMSWSKEDYDQDLNYAGLLQLIKCATNYKILEPYGFRHLMHVCASDDIPWIVTVRVQRILLRFRFSFINSFYG